MGRNRDNKMARKYSTPVEILREGLPQALQEAPDDEVRAGKLMRVRSAAGLKAALAQEAEKRQPRLQVYIVPYLPLNEAPMIREMLEVQKMPKGQRQAGVGEAAAANLRGFYIVNEKVLQAKELSYMAIEGEISNVDILMGQVRNNPEPPYIMPQLPSRDEDHGLRAGAHLKLLKEGYFAARALEGHVKEAKHGLKKFNSPLDRSLFRSCDMSEEEIQNVVMDRANEYRQEYLGVYGDPLDSHAIAAQILGLLSFVDFEDWKRLFMPNDGFAVEQKSSSQASEKTEEQVQEAGR